MTVSGWETLFVSSAVSCPTARALSSTLGLVDPLHHQPLLRPTALQCRQDGAQPSLCNDIHVGKCGIGPSGLVVPFRKLCFFSACVLGFLLKPPPQRSLPGPLCSLVVGSGTFRHSCPLKFQSPPLRSFPTLTRSQSVLAGSTLRSLWASVG